MMLTTAWLWIVLELGAAAVPAATVRTLEGKIVTGKLVDLGPTGASVEGGKPVAITTVPARELLSIEFLGQDNRTVPPPSLRVLLEGGSLLACESFTTKGGKATLGLGPKEIWNVPLESVLAVLLAPAQGKEITEFLKKANVARGMDVIDVMKDGRIFPLDGTLGDVHEGDLLFTVDGEEIPVRRERLSAMYFAHPPSSASPIAEVSDRKGNAWCVERITLADNRVIVALPGGIERQIPIDQVRRMDFSRGRVVSLSDCEPTLVQHVPFFDVEWNYRRDVNFNGETPKLLGQPFAKGLVVHSKTLIEFPLGGEYRRFEATVGIEDEAGRYGDALARVRGDGKILWESRLRVGEPPRPVAVNLEKLQHLAVEVDFGDGLDVGDHVLFGDARLIK